ncbi:type II toxin-antitoxin system RelE/ParE family toxin [Candidatus Hecatella orcuttiae]|uniref:type II toxin-antitoxin system RelE family toxin n=1 Tax=Candidatus Hecatella orcuttiae TaxID=1935119 RepID=UPI0028682D04|nr:type II toxin-antitoxin system RelE/ParE family toxin [Candidatus Hecatella orcuttiae]
MEGPKQQDPEAHAVSSGTELLPAEALPPQRPQGEGLHIHSHPHPPRPSNHAPDLAKLKGRENYYRLRVGDVRVVFKIDKPAKTIYVEKIGYREAVYR